MSDPAGNARVKNAITLALLLAVCAMPFAGAWLVYNFTDFWKVSGDNSRRDLLDPPGLIADAVLINPLHEDHEYHLYGKWNLLYLPAGDCMRACEQILLTMHQLRLAMGKEAPRLQIILATGTAYDDIFTDDDLRGFGGRLLLLDENRDTGEIFARFHALARDEGALYLIDPLGNLIVRYPPAADPAAITRDLKRLLRYSRIG